MPETAKKRFTACMSQAFTFHSAPTFSATRSSPRSSACSACTTAALCTGSASFDRSAQAASIRPRSSMKSVIPSPHPRPCAHRLLALREGRHQRHSYVTFSGAERRARRDDDPLLEELAGVAPGGVALRDPHPQVQGRLRRVRLQPVLREEAEEPVSLPPEDLAPLLRVRVLGP